MSVPESVANPQPAEPENDSAAAFSVDLRRLRLAADQPTLDTIARAAGISRTILSETFNGKALPSARTIDRVVRYLGADPAPWLERRDRLAAANGVSTSSEESEPAVESQPRRTVRARTAALLTVAGVVAGLVIGGGVGFGVGAANMAATPLAERTQIAVQNGLDPAKTACVDDSKVVVASKRTNNTLLEIKWSNKCTAAWARATRYDEQQMGNSITVSLYPQMNPDSADRQTATASDVNGVYTPLLVRPGDDLLCAVASMTLGGEEIDLGEPLCT
ncbi:DUF2690 domain-containing protein [Microbacterium sp. ZW T5_56]|uniref:DUF2690 domain-containing protein n=1 Tax=Microbacterium sp. ZW T5_56 TaxID=3378081 RepID=UPI0038550202